MDSRLLEIDEELTQSDVAALKFLCLDILTKKHLETVKDAKDLFLHLKEQSLLDDDHLLCELLVTIRRNDLLPILGTKKEELSQTLQVQGDSQGPGLSTYRKMLYEISKDITEESLFNFKLLSINLPENKKQKSTTFLDILTEMEKMGSLGENNLDELENILAKCAKDLVHKVQKFKNNSVPRPAVSGYSPNQMDRFQAVSQPETEFTEQRSKLVFNSIKLTATNFCLNLLNTRCIPVNLLSPQEPYIQIATPATDFTSSQHDQNLMLVSDSNSPTTSNEQDFYPVTSRPLGYCLIINNYRYQSESKFKMRAGSKMDEDALTEVFSRMHFQVEVRNDLSGEEISTTISEFSSMDHSRMDVFVCCILAHGQKDSVIGVDGTPVHIPQITHPFTCCTALTGKPKLFFIQACQGKKLQKGVWVADGPEEQDEIEDDARSISIPCEADILMGMSTVPNCKAFRNTKTGSIYIQELCRQLNTGCPRKEDILSILTKVNANVSKEEFLFDGCKQMPEPRYTLTKKLVLPMDSEA